MPEMITNDYSLIDILALRKWQRVLFTTYALSLTFFESYILRNLHQQGCREIFLITDVDGYQMSLSERRANRVGQEYRLIPVALPKGVFHPKCLYLSSPDGDFLAVGSGNMTFGGFGRNLEVFDILEPADNSKAFVDFADFLDLLDLRDDFIAPDRSWIQIFSNIARKSAGAAAPSSNSDVHLLHCVSESIIDQLVPICADYHGAKRITILSPFHDPQGAAIKKLANKTFCQHIRIALPPKENQLSTFPFDKITDWREEVSAVRLSGINLGRPLHAKWIEIDLNDGKQLVLTGSVNATSKSLCSTDNIEVGVVHLQDGNLLGTNWENAPIPSESGKQNYRTGGLGSKCIVHANIKNDGVVTGTIMATGEIIGQWEGYLENSLADQVPLTVTVSENGAFSERVANIEKVIYATGMQIAITKGNRFDRGWVNQEDILQLSHEHRSIIRIINLSDSVDDNIALLDYLSLSAHRHLSVFTRQVRIPENVGNIGNNRKADSANVSINLPSIAPDVDLGTSGSDLDTCDSTTDRSDDIFMQLRRRILGQRIIEKNQLQSPPDNDAEEGDEEVPREKDHVDKRFNDKLGYFERAIKEWADNAADTTKRRAALVIWFEVKLHMLQRHRDRENGLRFIRDWFFHVCSGKLVAEEPGALEQHLVTVAAILARLAESDLKGRLLMLTKIHECLERFMGGEIDLVYAEEALIDHPDVGFASFLLDVDAASLHDALHRVLSTVTLRTMLSDALKIYEKGEKVDASSLVFASKSGKELLSMLKRNPKAQFYKAAYDNRSMCSFCYITLPTMSENCLKYERIALCPSCGRFTVNLQP